jgi:hypothetical protein
MTHYPIRLQLKWDHPLRRKGPAFFDAFKVLEPSAEDLLETLAKQGGKPRWLLTVGWQLQLVEIDTLPEDRATKGQLPTLEIRSTLDWEALEAAATKGLEEMGLSIAVLESASRVSEALARRRRE